jgi:hypothetical protein
MNQEIDIKQWSEVLKESKIILKEKQNKSLLIFILLAVTFFLFGMTALLKIQEQSNKIQEQEIQIKKLLANNPDNPKSATDSSIVSANIQSASKKNSAILFEGKLIKPRWFRLGPSNINDVKDVKVIVYQPLDPAYNTISSDGSTGFTVEWDSKKDVPVIIIITYRDGRQERDTITNYRQKDDKP